VDGNLTATFLTIKCFLPGMKERRSGAIITMSSAAARRAHPQSHVPYAAAKAGVQMMTQHLAAQVGPYGIRVNCLAPETILTEKNTVPGVRGVGLDHPSDHRRGRRGGDGLTPG
jgi:3-oxoacyl-[acyl-carrier protein] reductase